MVLIHAGIHFNAILPWLATVAMGVNVISGMVGKIAPEPLAQQHVQGQREHLPVARPVQTGSRTGGVLGCRDLRHHGQVAQGTHPDFHRLRRSGARSHHQHLPVLGLVMSRPLKLVIAGNLIVLAVLAFVFPH
jgi:hypothetical protein